MSLKRLDEEFELKPGTQLLPYMKRLLTSLEVRFQDLEEVDRMLKNIGEDIRAAALLRMNEILIPATEDIIAVTKLGFLLAPVTDVLYTMKLGYMAVYVDDGPQRKTFTPSSYLIVEHTADPNNYSIARMIGYDQQSGILEMDVTAIHGDPGPFPWMVSSTPGMADSAKMYHDTIAPMHTEVVSDYEAIVLLHEEIMAAAQALADSGLDVYAFIRRDGTVPFEALQAGYAPPSGANDAYIPTTAWVRSRIIEYTEYAVKKTGDIMTGALHLGYTPTQDDHAVSKGYVDSAFGAGGTMRGDLTIQDSFPTLRLVPAGPSQDRLIEGYAPGNIPRWSIALGDGTPESGGNNYGSNFALRRYSDMGAVIDVPFWVDRSTGAINTHGVNIAGQLNVTGGMNFDGDLYLHRGTSGTGVIFLNHTGSAYHHWDGATHVFTGGGGSFGGNLSAQHVSCYSITTNGHYLTTWGMTSHGAAEINGPMTIRGDVVIEGGGANYIRFWDNTYGNSYIHHNDGIIGFLQHDGGWISYTNNAGQMWSRNYGWVHDYINQQANWYAWDAANYRYNQLVSSVRWAYCGDLTTAWNGGALGEPYGGAAITGFAGYNGSNMYVVYFRFRQLQYCVAGGWYASWYA
jgi:hypothetical protein